MAEIVEILSVRFLSSAAERFNIIPAQHKIRTAKTAPRFSVGINMNASDFLTKHINLAPKDAKSFLLEVYSQQLETRHIRAIRPTDALRIMKPVSVLTH